MAKDKSPRKKNSSDSSQNPENDGLIDDEDLDIDDILGDDELLDESNDDDSSKAKASAEKGLKKGIPLAKSTKEKLSEKSAEEDVLEKSTKAIESKGPTEQGKLSEKYEDIGELSDEDDLDDIEVSDEIVSESEESDEKLESDDSDLQTAETVAAAATSKSVIPEKKNEARAPQKVSSEENDDISEEVSSEEVEIEEEGETKKKSLGIVEIISLAIFLLLPIIGYFVFKSFVGTNPVKTAEEPAATFASKAKGKYLTLESVETFWREAKPSDRAPAGVLLIPQINLEIDQGSESGAAYIKLFIRDHSGRTMGDVIVKNVTGGKFSETGKPTLGVHCTAGLTKRVFLTDYRLGEQLKWSVEVLESNNAYAAEKDWTRIAYFNISGEEKISE